MPGNIAKALKLKSTVPLPPERPRAASPSPLPAPGGNIAKALELARTQESRSVLGEIAAMGPAIARGGGNVIAGAAEGLGLRQARRYAALLKDFDAIDRGEIAPSRLAVSREPAAMTDLSLILGPLAAYEKGTPEQRSLLRSKLLPKTDPRNIEAFDWGNELRKTLTGAFPEDPAYKGRFSQLLAEGIGSLGAFALTGAGTMGAGALPLGMLSGAAEGFRDAIVHGATLDDAFEASDLGTLIGATEFLPLVRMLRVGDRASGGRIRSALLRGIEGGTEEAAQESFAEIMRNLVASDVVGYDPERGTFRGTGTAAEVGGSTGALFGVVSGLVLGGRRVPPAQVRKELEDAIEGRTPPPEPVSVPPEPAPEPEAVAQPPVPPASAPLPPDLEPVPPAVPPEDVPTSRPPSEPEPPETAGTEQTGKVQPPDATTGTKEESAIRERIEELAAAEGLSHIPDGSRISLKGYEGTIEYVYNEGPDGLPMNIIPVFRLDDGRQSWPGVGTVRDHAVLVEGATVPPAPVEPEAAAPVAAEPVTVKPAEPPEPEAAIPPAPEPEIAPEPVAPPAEESPSPRPAERPGGQEGAVSSPAAPSAQPADGLAGLSSDEIRATVLPALAEESYEAHRAYGDALDAWKTADPEGHRRWDEDPKSAFPADTAEARAAQAASDAWRAIEDRQKHVRRVAEERRSAEEAQVASDIDAAEAADARALSEMSIEDLLAEEEARREQPSWPPNEYDYRNRGGSEGLPWFQAKAEHKSSSASPQRVREALSGKSAEDWRTWAESTPPANPALDRLAKGAREALADSRTVDGAPALVSPGPVVEKQLFKAGLATDGKLTEAGQAAVAYFKDRRRRMARGMPIAAWSPPRSLPKLSHNNRRSGTVRSGKDNQGQEWFTDGFFALRAAVPAGHESVETLKAGWTKIFPPTPAKLPKIAPVAVNAPDQRGEIVYFDNGASVDAKYYQWAVKTLGGDLDWRAAPKEGNGPLSILVDGKRAGVVMPMGQAKDVPPAVRALLAAPKKAAKPKAAAKPRPSAVDAVAVVDSALGEGGSRSLRAIFPKSKPSERADIARQLYEAEQAGTLPKGLRLIEASTATRGPKSAIFTHKLPDGSAVDYAAAIRPLPEPDIRFSREGPQPGPKHRGRRAETPFDKTKKMGAVPADRNRIVARLATDLGVPFYQGRVRKMAGPATAGFYKPVTGELRVERGSDVETMAHEAAHAIDARFPEIAQKFKADPAVARELRDVSYDRTSVAEGFAEFVRLWATQPEEALALAPATSAKWRDFLAGHPEVHKPFRRFRRDTLKWFEANPEARLVSKIGGQRVDPVGDAVVGRLGRLRQSVLDDFHGFFSASRKLDSNGAVDESRTTVYESMRLTRGAQALIAASFRYGAPVWRKNQSGIDFVGPGLRQIFAPVRKRQNQFYRYLVARRAAGLKRQGRENLLSAEEIKAGLALETPEFKKAALGYQEWNRKLLAFAVRAGVLDAASAQRMAQYFYVPFYRVGQEIGSGRGRKPGDWQGLRALRGGTQNLKPIGDNIRANAAMIIKASVDNWARQEAAKLAARKGGAALMAPVPAGARPVMIDKRQIADTVRRAVEREGLEIDEKARAVLDEALDAVAPLSQLWLLKQPAPGRNVVAVMFDGKPKWYEVPDPVVYRGFLAMNRPKPLAPGILRFFRRVGQAGVVLSAEFLLGNLQKDAIMSATVSRGHLIPVVDGLRGVKHRMMEDEVYRDFVANLGGMSSVYTDEEAVAAEAWLRTNGVDPGRVVNFPRVALNFVEKLLEAVEMGPKISEFRKARARGASGFKAAYEGRDVIDYAMKGDNALAVGLYDTVIFLKATLVSWDKLGRAVLTDPQRARTAFKIAMLLGLTAALHLQNKDNPEYEDLEDWKKDIAWHFWIEGEHYMMLKVWDLGFLANTVEHAMDRLDGKEGRDIADTIRRAYSLDFWPHMIEPIVEQMMNRERFFDREIVPPWIERRQTWAEYSPWTSPAMRKLGALTRDTPVEISPARAEAVVRGYLGTLGSYGLMFADRLVAPDEGLAKEYFGFPATRRWYEKGIPRSKAISDLYELRQEADEAWTTGRAIRNWEGLKDKAKLRSTLEKWAGSMAHMNKWAYRAMEETDPAKLRKMALAFRDEAVRRKAAEAGNAPRKLRRVIVDEITARKNRLSRSLLKNLNAMRASLTKEGKQ